MTPTLLMSELAKLVKALTENPDNYYTKTETLALMKQVKMLATQGDKMAQYQLAQLFPKKSDTYLNLMQASAKQGLTNAMLVLSRDYAANGKVSGLQKAAQYIVKILASGDSYIKSEAEALMAHNRLLDAEVQRQMPKGIGKSAFGLFAQDPRAREMDQPDLQNSAAPAA